ncbi:branched-chain amino acid ABC transporter permease [Desulfococcaceae bacterium HSG7]|nr:branched-chain amino acid ABC transporter permease [Desulfococcaceae bacterium HSG9]MDM8557025.1 branched-chain amino acid ABC transporter permease [Desulfococcaceae bacterium HSG7]
MSSKRMATIMGVTYGIAAIMPFFVGDIRFIMHILIMCLIWAVVASCWDLIMGFAGIFSFGQVAFFVIGAYTSAILSVQWNVPSVVAILLAGVFTAGMGVIVGLPCLKLAGPYVALVTFGVHMTLMPVLRGEIGIALGSGGSQGILTIPPVNILGYTFSSANQIPTFYFTLFLSVVCTVIILAVIKSYWGTAFLALKDSEEFAMSLGVSAFKYKLMVFALTSFLTGVMGAFYGHYIGMLSTRMLELDLFCTLMVMLVVGGIGRFPGAILGAFITVTANELLAPLGAYRAVTLGALVVLLVLLLPNGVMGLWLKRSDAEA